VRRFEVGVPPAAGRRSAAGGFDSTAVRQYMNEFDSAAVPDRRSTRAARTLNRKPRTGNLELITENLEPGTENRAARY